MSHSEASSHVLEVDGLRTEFHLRDGVVAAVDGVSFAVDAGECVGLVGESGCGKSTTGLSLMRLLPNVGHLRSGSVWLNGQDLTRVSQRRMRAIRGNEVAMIYQDPMTSLNPTMTIGAQIDEAVRLHETVSRQAARDRTLEVLDLVGVPRPAERLAAYPHQLSGGLRQRVMIAMALACEPSLLIADEPTTGLDVTIQAQILDLIDDLRERLRMAVLLITHDMGVIAARTDRVIVMYAGKIVESTDTVTLFSAMRHPYTRGLLDSIPRLDRDVVRLRSIPGAPPSLGHPPSGCRFRTRCTRATEICADVEPPLTGEGRHLAACHHPLHLARPDEDQATNGALDAAYAVEREPDREAAPAPLAESSAIDGSGPALLEVRHLVKEFPVGGAGRLGGRRSLKAVSDVTFTLREGQTFGLVGESGSGKTTLGRLIVGLERPTSGSVLFAGEDVSTLRGRRLREHRRRVQLMFQDPYASLDPRMRVGATVREPLAVQRIGSRAEQLDRAADLLSEVGVESAALALYPHEFSGGQRQRIGLARALILNPQLIVADEPVSALDVSVQAQVLNLMRSLQDAHGLTYVVISHDLSVVRFLADVIGVMYLGKLVEIGPAREIYGRAAHPYTRGLLESIPVPDPAHLGRRQRAAVQGELPSPIDPPSGCRFRTRCPLAQDICAEQEPPLDPFGPGHFAACHFPLQPRLAEPAAGAGSAPSTPGERR